MFTRFSASLQSALAAGRPVVTPNNRMARTLVRAYDGARQAAAEMGAVAAWPTARVLPHAAFVDALWLQLSATMPLPRRLSAQACRILWREIVEQDADDAMLYATGGAAALAQEAWQLLRGWRAENEAAPWRQWRREGVAADAARFARWAARYEARLDEGGFIDAPSMPDFIAAHAERLSGGVDRAWTMAGFVEHTPQSLRLTAALRDAGIDVDDVPSVEMDGSADAAVQVFRRSSRNAVEEMREALSWAWQWIRSRPAPPGPRVAIVVPSLGSEARAVRRLVADCLPEPESCNVSLGEPLSEKPLVTTALELLALFDQPLPMGRAAALLRSAYLPGDERSRLERAALERRWLEDGRRDVSWREAVNALESADPRLAAQWRRVENTSAALPGEAVPGAWPRYLLQWWQALGWPGSQTLDSTDYQVREAWLRCLEKLPLLEAVAPRLARRELLQTLKQWAVETLFQPEGSEAPIQILGMLEAAGLPFEALWVTGLDSIAWPPPSEPHALLPLAWQRARQLPRATVERTFAAATQMQAQWRRMAPWQVLSHPLEHDGQACTPAAALSALPEYEGTPAALLAGRIAQATSAVLETLDDECAPAVLRGEAIRHGSSVLAQQSDCPFKAFVHGRLQARIWPEASEGLSPIERGNLVHAVSQRLWQRWQSQDALLALDAAALDAEIETAYREAVADGKAIRPARWRTLPAAVAALEGARLAALLRAWCTIEKTRSPFTVAHTEKQLRLELADMTYELRADRIDRLADGGTVLIDYKTGREVPIPGWFEARPSTVQLGVYALAWQALPEASAEPVRALVYAHLREEGASAHGVVENGDASATVWPELKTVAHFGFASMAEAQMRWRDVFTALTRDFLGGDARVLPRNVQVCRTCGLQALCRVGELPEDEEDDDNGREGGERSGDV